MGDPEVEVVENQTIPVISYEINTKDWEEWGSGADISADVPAKGWFDLGAQKYSFEISDFRLMANGDIRGCGDDINGQFDIIGRLNASGYFKFEKIYRGAHSVVLKWVDSLAHTVVYRGKRHGPNLTGKWEIPGKCEGVFKIQASWQKWVGTSYCDSKEFSAFDVGNMHLGYDGVTGTGSDKIGTFDIKGSRNEYPKPGKRIVDKDGRDTWEYRFTKQYHGKHTIVFYGNLHGAELTG